MCVKMYKGQMSFDLTPKLIQQEQQLILQTPSSLYCYFWFVFLTAQCDQLSLALTPTCLVDVLLARVPDAGVEAAEEEAIVPGLPAVVHLVLVRLVHAVVDAVVAPLLAAVGLGHALCALAPVRGDEGGGGEEQGHEVQTHGQQRATFPRRLHDLGASGRVRAGGEKVHPRKREKRRSKRRRRRRCEAR